MPPAYKERQLNVQKKDRRLLIALCPLIVSTGLYLGLTFLGEAADKSLYELDRQIEALEGSISQLEYLESISRDMTSLYAQAVQAAGGNPKWRPALLAIGNSVPGQILLQNLKFSYQAVSGLQQDASKCIVQGMAANHRTVAQWLSVLEGLDEVEALNLSFSADAASDQEVQSGYTVQFEITLQLRSGSAYQLPGEVTADD